MDASNTRKIIEAHWALANQRDWVGFAALIANGCSYEVPQTREFIESGEGYVDMFQTWPGAWIASVKHLVCEGSTAICIIDFRVAAEVMTGISHFQLADSKIVSITDYWPEPYEPPARMTRHMKRRELC